MNFAAFILTSKQLHPSVPAADLCQKVAYVMALIEVLPI